MTDTEIVIIGGGAAGIAAARALHRAQIPYRLIEARSRLGGRGWTIAAPEQGDPIDLGCGWLHSADLNPWTEIAEAAGVTLDRTPPPWTRPSIPTGFALDDQRRFRDALDAFYDRVHEAASQSQDAPASENLVVADPWNALIGAVATYVTGAELDQVSTLDLHRYDDSGVNWRVAEGYGHLIASTGAEFSVALDCVAREIDHSGARLRIATSQGTIACDRVIVTIPTNCLAAGAIRFHPDLPDKLHAAARLPLGFNDKLFLALESAEEFEQDSRIFGHTDRVATAAYHMRPFGRPQIEGYFGGSLARELEGGGEPAFFEFARDELVRLLGSGFARRIRPLALHRWGADEFSLGAYSYALPGHADERATLAAPVEQRIYFAGEACSAHDFSTAHGAYRTGLAAAEAATAARR